MSKPKQTHTPGQMQKPAERIPKWLKLCQGAAFVRKVRLENGVRNSSDIERQNKADYLLYIRLEGTRRISEGCKAIDDSVASGIAALKEKRDKDIAAAAKYELKILARAEGLLEIVEGMKRLNARANKEKEKLCAEVGQWVRTAPTDSVEYSRWLNERKLHEYRERMVQLLSDRAHSLHDGNGNNGESRPMDDRI